MNKYRYAPQEELKKIKNIIYKLMINIQDEIRHCFAFGFNYTGMTQQNMVTYNPEKNIGFDLEISITIKKDHIYTADEIISILDLGLEKFKDVFNYEYSLTEYAPIIIKLKDPSNNNLIHICDLLIVHQKQKEKNNHQYIKYNQDKNYYIWKPQTRVHYSLKYRLDWCKKNKLWDEIRHDYIVKKNLNIEKECINVMLFYDVINETEMKHHKKRKKKVLKTEPEKKE